jgi:hypothetical protein
MWWASGSLGFVAEHPETLEQVYLTTNSGRIEAMSFWAWAASALGCTVGGLERLYGVPAARRIRPGACGGGGCGGGVGSWAAEALARSGVGRLTLIDMDHVAESNINRQVHALMPPWARPRCRPCASALRRHPPGLRGAGHRGICGCRQLARPAG